MRKNKGKPQAKTMLRMPQIARRKVEYITYGSLGKMETKKSSCGGGVTMQ